ncbi:2216_t:CDS:1 [Ambispora gerdemannii]|uniref:2216_t:CDS:1 n=1 Tax=Ambispora gerdemannii TaxID=144530 RepID=A0A9N8Z699_9GLOM|nr:2216_t:CDS:1 [Ambispora gerdemannii]
MESVATSKSCLTAVVPEPSTSPVSILHKTKALNKNNMALNNDILAQTNNPNSAGTAECERRKSVRFSRFEKVYYTHSPITYDRSPIHLGHLGQQHQTHVPIIGN